MIKIRRSQDRGYADHGWLKSHHTFSFAGYYDPAHMGFRSLRVINQDLIAGGGGFPTHPHRDMEIISYMVDGELRHRDSMGHSEVIKRGEVQYMCAGTGVAHSEFNAHADRSAHLMQIWIIPEKTGLKPSYGQKSFLDEFASGKLTHVLSQDGRNGSVQIHQNANLWVGWLTPQSLELPLNKERHGWLQVIKGSLKIGDEQIAAGDAVAFTNESNPKLEAITDAEVLFFDLA